MRALKFIPAHPLQTVFALIVSLVVFFPLWIFFPWFICLPWALFAAASLRLEIKEEAPAQRLLRRLGI